MYKGMILIKTTRFLSQVIFYKRYVVEKSCLLEEKGGWKFNIFNTNF